MTISNEVTKIPFWFIQNSYLSHSNEFQNLLIRRKEESIKSLTDNNINYKVIENPDELNELAVGFDTTAFNPLFLGNRNFINHALTLESFKSFEPHYTDESFNFFNYIHKARELELDYLFLNRNFLMCSIFEMIRNPERFSNAFKDSNTGRKFFISSNSPIKFHFEISCPYNTFQLTPILFYYHMTSSKDKLKNNFLYATSYKKMDLVYRTLVIDKKIICTYSYKNIVKHENFELLSIPKGINELSKIIIDNNVCEAKAYWIEYGAYHNKLFINGFHNPFYSPLVGYSAEFYFVEMTKMFSNAEGKA